MHFLLHGGDGGQVQLDIGNIIKFVFFELKLVSQRNNWSGLNSRIRYDTVSHGAAFSRMHLSPAL